MLPSLVPYCCCGSNRPVCGGSGKFVAAVGSRKDTSSCDEVDIWQDCEGKQAAGGRGKVRSGQS